MSIKRRKRFLPAAILAFFSWAVVVSIIFFVNPIIFRDLPVRGSYLPFFLFLFFAIFLTGSFLFANSRRGFLAACGVIVFLYLRLLGLGHLLNAVLLFGFLVFLELAFSSQTV